MPLAPFRGLTRDVIRSRYHVADSLQISILIKRGFSVSILYLFPTCRPPVVRGHADPRIFPLLLLGVHGVVVRAHARARIRQPKIITPLGHLVLTLCTSINKYNFIVRFEQYKHFTTHNARVVRSMTAQSLSR